MVSLTTGGIRSVIYEGTSILADLYIKVRLCCFRLSARELHPHSLYRFSMVTDLVRPVTILADAFLSRSSPMELPPTYISATPQNVSQH